MLRSASRLLKIIWFHSLHIHGTDAIEFPWSLCSVFSLLEKLKNTLVGHMDRKGNGKKQTNNAVSSGDIAVWEGVSNQNQEVQCISWIFFHLNSEAADFPSLSFPVEISLISVPRHFSDGLKRGFAWIHLRMAHNLGKNYQTRWLQWIQWWLLKYVTKENNQRMILHLG